MRVAAVLSKTPLIALLIATNSAVADVTPVLIDAGTLHERTGVLVSQEGQCVVLTAAHEIDRRISMNVTLNGRIFPATLSWNGLRLSEPIDVALLRFSQPVKADCDSLASPERISEALRKSEGQLWLPPIGGQVPTPSVRTKLRDAKTLTLSQVEPGESPLTKGISGAPVVFDGLVVGILRGNTDRQFLATRLDHLLRVAGDEVKLRRFDLAAQATFTPYDLAALPAPIAEEVRSARKLREEAELVSRLAREVEERADELARLAEEETKSGTGMSSNRRAYATPGGDRYAGETNTKSSFFSTTTTSYPQGYGVLNTLTGTFKGEVKKCIWVDEGRVCKGPMVNELAPSASPWRRMEIERVDNMPTGPARIVFRSGTIGFVMIRTKHNREAGSWSSSIEGSGVLEFPDGRRYEGAVNNIGGNGLGASWDSQGKLTRSGLWKDGNAVD